MRTALIGSLVVVSVGAFIFSRAVSPTPRPVIVTLSENSVVRQPVAFPVSPPASILPKYVLPPEVALQPRTQPDAKPVAHFITLKTPALGSTTGGGPYQKISGQGEPIIGFLAISAPWMGRSIVHTLEPIYATDNLVPTPSMVLARRGYAVGGVILDGDQDVQAMRIVFLRQLGDSLDPADRYESDWIGKPTRTACHVLACNGDRVVGIYGRRGLNLDALGLVIRRENSAPKPAAVATGEAGRW